MSLTLWIVITIVIVAMAGAIWMVYARRRKTAALRERFGPEYDHVLHEHGEEPQRAEKELQARAVRVEHLNIRPLSAERSLKYSDDWREVQNEFVDDPEVAIERADHLLLEVMEARGYPMGDFEQRAADISVDHPREVEHYRAAHQIANRATGGVVSTEELRQAMVHYRALFEDLIDGRQAATAADARS